ncbi:hypothetical protein DFH11DRAFT_1725801 [Phellopilus nigrolimitatus]|nr:hypothetical protein DFH11DRAFT_1725801 [Phellopilus nigrolimitatus]
MLFASVLPLAEVKILALDVSSASLDWVLNKNFDSNLHSALQPLRFSGYQSSSVLRYDDEVAVDMKSTYAMLNVDPDQSSDLPGHRGERCRPKASRFAEKPEQFEFEFPDTNADWYGYGRHNAAAKPTQQAVYQCPVGSQSSGGQTSYIPVYYQRRAVVFFSFPWRLPKCNGHEEDFLSLTVSIRECTTLACFRYPCSSHLYDARAELELRGIWMLVSNAVGRPGMIDPQPTPSLRAYGVKEGPPTVLDLELRDKEECTEEGRIGDGRGLSVYFTSRSISPSAFASAPEPLLALALASLENDIGKKMRTMPAPRVQESSFTQAASADKTEHLLRTYARLQSEKAHFAAARVRTGRRAGDQDLVHVIA